MKSMWAGLVLVGCTAVFAQDVRLSFDAASIKPVEPLPVGGIVPAGRVVCPVTGCRTAGRIMFTYASLKSLIEAAYDVRPYQVEGPAWLSSARFDVVGTFPHDATRDQVNLRLQTLLAERFQLRLNRSTREMPVYGLVVSENGSRLKRSIETAPKGRGTTQSGLLKRFEFEGWTMAMFAQALELDAERPVLDMTGLDGRFDVRLEFSSLRRLPFDVGAPAAASGPQVPELFTALRDQLGLKLEPRRGPVPVLIVESASQQPTAD